VHAALDARGRLTRETENPAIMTGDGHERLAIIAGGGSLPAVLARRVAETGRPFSVFAIRDEADAEALAPFQPIWLGWGEIGRLFKVMKEHGCRDIVLIGSVRRRPSLWSMLGDWGTVRRLPRILKAIVGGDDSVLKKVIGIFESEGFRIVGAHDVAPELLAPEGCMTAKRPDETSERDIATGSAMVHTLSPFDVGQAVVIARGRVIAVEAAEGTDAMLQRCATLRNDGRIGPAGCGVLVKCVKAGQELRTDLPTIGPATVEAVAAAGLSGIAVEAGHVLIAEPDETIAIAERAGIFLIGVPVGQGS